MKYQYLTLALLSSSFIFCEEEGRIRNLENRITCLENTQMNYCCMINPPARPFNPDCWGFYINIDPLIWQARVNGTGVAIETKGDIDFFNSIAQSRVKNLNYDWDWGFRLGVGLNLNHDAWDVLVQWTRWSTEARRNFSAGADQGIYPHFSHPDPSGFLFAKDVKAKWELCYNTIDLEGTREFCVSKCVSLRPFGGLRTAWIDQEKFNLVFDNLADVDGFPINFTKIRVKQSDRFWGIGIRSGLDMQWGLGCGFSLFNNFAGNLLYSYHSVKHREFTDDELIFDVGNFFHMDTAVFDLQIGIAYDWISCDCCYHVGLDLGWEHHWYSGMNQFFLFADDIMYGQYVANQGDLGIQGYYLKVRFDF